MRLYHVVVIVEKQSMVNFGKKLRLTGAPLTHEQACTFMSKISNYPWRRKQLEEVV